MEPSIIEQISSEELDKLFENASEGSPNAELLTGGQQPALDDITDDELNGKVAFGTKKAPEEIPTETEEEKVAKLKEVEDVKLAAKAKGKNKEEKPEEDNTTPEVTTDEVKTVLKNTVDYLIDKGFWGDFDGREDLEITEEVYAELVQKQDEFRVNSLFSELLDSTGDYGKAIISHIKSGGNPDEIIDLFKEQKQLEQIDTTTDDGKQTVIEKYYKDTLGWKKEKVDKLVQRLIKDDEIGTEFTDVKEAYDKHYKDELAATQETAKQAELQVKQRHTAFINSIQTALKSDETLTPRDKALVASSILDFKHTLPNGKKVNDFYIKFAEMQADPKEYIELAKFVLDKEKFKQELTKKVETKVASTTFNFIKGNAAAKKTTDSPQQTPKQNKDLKPAGTNFSFAIK